MKLIQFSIVHACLLTSNALIQLKQLMLVYKECFNTVQIAHASLRRVFQCGRVYLHFTYNDIYICYMQSPHLISIIKCRHHLPQWQWPLTATLRFQQQFVLDETPLQQFILDETPILVCYCNTFTMQFQWIEQLNWSINLLLSNV